MMLLFPVYAVACTLPWKCAQTVNATAVFFPLPALPHRNKICWFVFTALRQTPISSTRVSCSKLSFRVVDDLCFYFSWINPPVLNSLGKFAKTHALYCFFCQTVTEFSIFSAALCIRAVLSTVTVFNGIVIAMWNLQVCTFVKSNVVDTSKWLHNIWQLHNFICQLLFTDESAVWAIS